jgi:hypothetical protein
MGLTLEDLESGRYLRIRHIRKLMESGALDIDLRWQSVPAGVALDRPLATLPA